VTRRGWIAQIASLLSALGLGGGFALQAYERSECWAIVEAQQASYQALVMAVTESGIE
jgi:hypothetical protein